MSVQGTMLQAFQEENFDPREWINEELQALDPSTLGSAVHGLSLKLQVLGNEVNAGFEDQIIQTLAKLPMGLIDLERIEKESVQLAGSLSNILAPEVIEKQQVADEATHRISQLHETKTNLDMCQSTLSKTVYLRDNVHLMKKAFEKGDTSHIASEIAKMQQALEAIRGFEHYDEMSKTIIGYEARLQEMVEVECVEALLSRDTLKAQQHLATLRKINRLNEIVVQYTKKAVQPIVSQWKDFATANQVGSDNWEETFLAFLPNFNTKVEQDIGKSKKYYTEVFQEDCSKIVVEWYMMMQRELAHQQSKYYGSLTLPGLVKAYQGAMQLTTFLKENHIKNGSPDQLEMLQGAALGPFTHLQSTYPDLEVSYLLGRIASFRFVTELASSSTITINPTLVADITDTTTQLIHECQTSIERCLLFSPSNVLVLVRSLNSVLTSFSGKILDVVKKLRVALQLVPGKEVKEKYAAEDPVKLKLTLQLYSTASGMDDKVKLFEVWLRELAGKHSAMKDMEEELFSSEGDLGALSKEVETIVFDLLFEAVESRFRPLPGLDVWAQQTSSPSSIHFQGSMPMDAIRQTGEYLLSLPEALGQVCDMEDDHWIMHVLNKAAEHFTDQVLSIPHISEEGMRQLATDVEYLVNVMGAFDVDMPNLRVLLTLTTTPESEYSSILDDLKAIYPEGAEKLHSEIIAKKRCAP